MRRPIGTVWTSSRRTPRRAPARNCGTARGVSEQKFILVAADRGQGPVPGQWTIRSKSAGKCLYVGGGAGTQVTQVGCYAYNQAQSWELRSTGEIVNIYSGLCLDTAHDQKGAAVMVWPCNGNIAQHWFF
ncbi:RICIN domain-containing protein [Streptomyces sp. SLBN-8D4]|uniref:RICIN domain-containing protein n=1 Tax=Streptomyces sp. SLBN-8D4 TaxID=3377728 RepID=UPI003C7AE164